jgi:hypothetical protein
MANQLKLQGASVPERASSLAHWNPVLLSAFLPPVVYLIKLLLNLTLLLDCFSLDMARQFSVLEEKHSQSQAELV